MAEGSSAGIERGRAAAAGADRAQARRSKWVDNIIRGDAVVAGLIGFFAYPDTPSSTTRRTSSRARGGVERAGCADARPRARTLRGAFSPMLARVAALDALQPTDRGQLSHHGLRSLQNDAAARLAAELRALAIGYGLPVATGAAIGAGGGRRSPSRRMHARTRSSAPWYQARQRGGWTDPAARTAERRIRSRNRRSAALPTPGRHGARQDDADVGTTSTGSAIPVRHGVEAARQNLEAAATSSAWPGPFLTGTRLSEPARAPSPGMETSVHTFGLPRLHSLPYRESPRARSPPPRRSRARRSPSAGAAMDGWRARETRGRGGFGLQRDE